MHGSDAILKEEQAKHFWFGLVQSTGLAAISGNLCPSTRVGKGWKQLANGDNCDERVNIEKIDESILVGVCLALEDS